MAAAAQKEFFMKRNNYAIQAGLAKQRFLTYDQGQLIKKFHMAADEDYLYPVMLGLTYRLDRKTGNLEKQVAGNWHDANGFHEVMTLLDLVCDAKPQRCLSGRWKSMQDFGMQFHQNLVEERPGPAAEHFNSHPECLHAGCLALGGRPLGSADISYAIELFDGLQIAVQFWHGDDEFAPRLRYLWDENALMYIRYETMYYAVGLLLERLTQGSLHQA